MTESHAESTTGTWKVPECPFAIQYSLQVFDDIRLAVMDAFFSLPRGGAEIGGVLIGQFAGKRLVISGYAPLDCEHAMGPSFTLSHRDETRLEELIAEVTQAGNGIPVGWYHSHTRTDIFLSDADLRIHERFFPESWQIALVMKPHTFQPMRCGFFFRESGGDIHSEGTYLEFALDPLQVQTLPSGEVPLPEDAVVSSEPIDSSASLTVIPVEVRTLEPPVPQRPPIEPRRPVREFAVPERREPEPTAEELEPVARVPQPPIPQPKPPVREPDPPPRPPDSPVREPEPDPLPEREPDPAPRIQAPPEPVIARPAFAAAAAAPALEEPEVETARAVEPPMFFAQAEEPSSRFGLKGILVVGLGIVLGAAAFQTRQQWWPKSSSAPPVAPVPAFAAVGLGVTDNDGQLQIHWDGNAPAVRLASEARLTISDTGVPPRDISLDQALLQSGKFAYSRQGDAVTVALTLAQPGGQQARESVAFMGKAPAPKPVSAAPAPVAAPTDSEIRKQRDKATAEAASLKKELATQMDLNRNAVAEGARLRKDLAAQAERNRKLQKQLDDAREQIREQQRKRLATQIPK